MLNFISRTCDRCSEYCGLFIDELVTSSEITSTTHASLTCQCQADLILSPFFFKPQTDMRCYSCSLPSNFFLSDDARIFESKSRTPVVERERD